MKKTSIVALFLMAMMSLCAVPQASAQTAVINQGDRFYTNNIGCTIGYIDHKAHSAWTAGHCASYNGETAYDYNGYPVGTIYTNFNPGNHRNDRATIFFYDSVRLGGNGYSGDAQAGLHNVRAGDTICSYGATSQKVHCDAVTEVDGHVVIARGGAGGIHGDSGGPAWIPGKGYVGVYSIYWMNDQGYYDYTGFTHQHGDDPMGNYPITPWD